MVFTCLRAKFISDSVLNYRKVP